MEDDRRPAGVSHRWRLLPQGPVGPLRVVLDPPGLDHRPRRQSAREQARRHAERECSATLYAEVQRLTDAGGSILGSARAGQAALDKMLLANPW